MVVSPLSFALFALRQPQRLRFQKMAISNNELLEVHTAKRLNWFFTALSGLALAGIAYAALFEPERSLIAVALLFAIGLAVGVHTLLHPRTLLRLHETEIILFPGTLWGN